MAKDGESLWLAAAAVERYARELGGYQEARAPDGRSTRRASAISRFCRTSPRTPDAFRVLPADFVSTDDGTGVRAPRAGLRRRRRVRVRASRHRGAEPGARRRHVRRRASPTSRASMCSRRTTASSRACKSDGALFSASTYTHDYPHCWRCDSPLLYRAITTWFVRVTDVKADMLAVNGRIRWVPEHIRDGRFGNWLENARDWAVSRNRFWGAPVPVWRCDACASRARHRQRAELEEKSGTAVTDWHRPAIDERAWPCSCGGTMTRVPDVLDCWFESGAMPLRAGALSVRARSRSSRPTFPGDFIVEYIAQTRGWFYTLLVALGGAVRRAAVQERRLSRRHPRRGRPQDVQAAEQLSRSDGARRRARLRCAADRAAQLGAASAAPTCGSRAPRARRRAPRLHPAVELPALLHGVCAIDRFEATGQIAATDVLDRYLLSETDRLRQDLEDLMAAYDVAGCYEAIETYVLMLSTWYVRLSKRRFWQSGVSEGKRAAYETLHAALETFAIVSAPFLPFLCESIHDALGGTRSVHLRDWPEPRHDWRDHELSDEMRMVRTIVRLTRSVRETHRVSHRQPLLSVAVANVPPGSSDRISICCSSN